MTNMNGGAARALLTATACAGLCVAAPVARAQAQQVSTDDPVVSDEIIVIGEKIDRSLKDTGTAVTVLRKVDPQEFRSPYDVASRVPNMVSTAADLPSIRGVTGSGAASGIFTLMSGARPRIAVVVDGMAETFAGQRYADAGMWDVDQVEVLRGPQSTTTGRNSLGGAIVIQTKDPTWDWEGAVRAGVETQGLTGIAAGVVSGPIVRDELAFRLAADTARGESYIDYDAGTGFPFDPGRISRAHLRGKLLWKPQAVPGLTARITGTKRWSEGEYLFSATGPDFFAYRWDNPLLNTRTSDSGVGTLSAELDYEITADTNAHLFYGHGWFDANFRQSNQNSSPRSQGRLDVTEQNNTAELRLTHRPGTGAFSGVLGLYYYDRHQDLRSDLGVNGPDRIRTYAAYVDADVRLGGGLNLLLGGRIEREEQKRDVALSWGRVSGEVAQTIVLPKAGLRYAITPDTNLVATVRKGYSPGGAAIDWITGDYYTYDKESVWTYEVGSRTVLSGGALTLATNLFLNDYRGYQSLVDSTFTNIPEARSYGFEIEVGYRPWSGLDIFGSIGVLRTDIREAPRGFEKVNGRPLDNAPSFTGSLGFNQTFTGGFFIGGNVHRVSRYNSQVESGTAIAAGDFTVFNANIGYATDRWTIRAYVKNLGDEHVLFSARTNRFGDIQGQVGQPRAFGVTGDWRF